MIASVFLQTFWGRGPDLTLCVRRLKLESLPFHTAWPFHVVGISCREKFSFLLRENVNTSLRSTRLASNIVTIRSTGTRLASNIVTITSRRLDLAIFLARMMLCDAEEITNNLSSRFMTIFEFNLAGLKSTCCIPVFVFLEETTNTMTCSLAQFLSPKHWRANSFSSVGKERKKIDFNFQIQ